MRRDGKHVTNVDPMYTLAPYFMRERNDAMNMITVDIPYDDVHRYVLDLRKRGYRVSHMAVIIAAYVRMICDYPALNRFVVNSKIYARNDFSIGMVVLRPGESDPSMSKMKFDLESTIFEINDIINDYVDANNKVDSNNASDDLFRKLLSCPPLVRTGMALLRGLDHIGLLPKAIIDLSPFHNSIVFTNLASIRTNDIYHHAYNFGTVSIVISMGNYADILSTVQKIDANDKVTVYYTGTFIDGEEFDARKEEEGTDPFEFTVKSGYGGVIAGWIEGLQLASKGSELELFVPSELAYGKNSYNMEPNKTLIFKIKVVDVKKYVEPVVEETAE